MVRIHLMGKPAAIYGRKPIEVDAPNVQMAMQCLFNMFGPRFKQMIREGEWHLTRNKKLKECTDPEDTYAAEEIRFGFGNITDLYLYPKVRAHKAALRVIVGIILVVVGVVFTPVSAGFSNNLTALGISLIAGGVAEMLAPKPEMGNTGAREDQPSFMFNGTQNTNESGVAVPIIYGRVRRASSIVLSAGMTSENLTSATNVASNQDNYKRGDGLEP